MSLTVLCTMFYQGCIVFFVPAGMDKYDILDGAIENSSFLVLFVSSKVLGDKDGFRRFIISYQNTMNIR